MLEERVGARLFTRTTRKVRLTDAGERFVIDARKILADLAEAEAAASGATKALKGRIRLTAPVLFGRSRVAPAVLEFMHKHPEISVDVILGDRLSDLVEEGIDLAVRIGHLADSSLKVLRVGSVHRVLCASPAYIARRGLPATLDELAKMDGIELASASARQWTFAEKGRERTVRPRIILTANSPEIVISACVDGLGAARFMDYQVCEEIAKGRLVRFLDTLAVSEEPVQLIHAAQGQLPRRVRALFDHLAAALSGRAGQAAAWPLGTPAFGPGFRIQGSTTDFEHIQ